MVCTNRTALLPPAAHIHALAGKRRGEITVGMVVSLAQGRLLGGKRRKKPLCAFRVFPEGVAWPLLTLGAPKLVKAQG